MFLRDCRYVSALIFADLRFEWILSVCMVLSLGAVFAPLFILLGLQNGIVGNMLDKLRSDPASRLVTPKFPLENPLDEVWLRSLRELSEVVITSPTSTLLLEVEGLIEPVNAVPTVPSDPLLVENRISLPGEGFQIVLSERLAQLTEKHIGDPIRVTLIRNVGREEKAPIKFRVAGILPKAASEDAKIWIPETLFRSFYRWRNGHAVPELGLTGKGAILVPEYDGAITLLDRVPTDEEYRRMLAGKMSFSKPPEPLNHLGWKVGRGRKARLWKPINSRIYEADLQPLANRHNELGYTVELVPFVEALEVTLSLGEKSEKLTAIVAPTVLELDASGNDPAAVPSVWAYPGDGIKECTKGEISFQSGNRGKELSVPVRICPSPLVNPGFLVLPRKLAGTMNAARRQESFYDPESGEFSPSGEGMRFFRAYAQSIDKIEELVEFIRRDGETRAINALREPNSRVGEVRNIRRLANYMEQLYNLIVLVSGFASFFAIVASVYAGIQRKRHDLAYLQLFGIHPGALFLFPCLKSLVLVAGGIATALIAYSFFGYFSAHLFPETKYLTCLSLLNIVSLLTGILTAASVASLFAATAVIRIDPGEYIRD